MRNERGDPALGDVERQQVHRVLEPARRLDDDLTTRGQGRDRGLYQLGVHLEERGRSLDERRARRGHVPLVGQRGEDVKNTCLTALGRRSHDADVHGDGVGRLKADAEDVRREPVGIVANERHGAVAVAFEDLDGVRGLHAVRLQEHHDVFDGALLDPSLFDLVAPNASDPLHFEQPIGILVDDVQRFQAEVTDEPLGHHFADPANEARAEVAFDADERHGHDRLERLHLELLAEALVVNPSSLELQVFAGSHAEQIAHGGGRFLAAGHGDLDDAPRAFLVGERHAFEHTLEPGALAGSAFARATSRRRWARSSATSPPEALLRCHGASLPRLRQRPGRSGSTCSRT